MSILSEERKTEIISFVGLEKVDVLYYATRIIDHCKKLVLVIDNSNTKCFFNAIRSVSSSNYGQYGRVSVLKDVTYSRDFFNQYDVVFIYHGMNVDISLMNISDKNYVFTNYEPSTVKLLEAPLKEFGGELSLIFRDKVHKKISEKILENELQLSCKVLSRQVMEFDLLDYELYLNFLHNGSQSAKKVSPQMEEITINIVSEVLHSDNTKELRKKLRSK